jgi:mannitol/fructose-specific phosphotransferase system IIA component (Ntr-type)
VVPHLKSRDKLTAIRETIRRAPVFSALSNLAELEEAVIEMEKTHSTGLGRGVAIAHGTSPEVDEVRIALGVSERGIDFDSVDDIPVRYLFIIVHPPEMQMEYLIALAAVVRMIRDRAFRESLDPTLPAAVLEEMIYRAFRGCLRFYQRTVA